MSTATVAQIPRYQGTAALLRPLFLLFFVCFWLVVSALRWQLPESTQSNLDALAQYIVLMACCMMAGYGSMQASSLATGARVLLPRIAPTGLWRRWLRSGLQELTVLWGMALFGVVTLMLPTHGTFGWLTAAGLVSASLTLAVFITLMVLRLLPSKWNWGLVPAALVAVYGLRAHHLGITQTLLWLESLPWLVPVACIASWPLLGLWLTQRWHDAPPSAAPNPLAPVWAVFRRARQHTLRYTSLASLSLGSYPTGEPLSSPFWTCFWLWVVASVIPVRGVVDGALGFALSELHGFLWFTLWMLFTLQCRDLHWRTLLAPGGLRLGRIGLHIVLSSYAVWSWRFAIIGAVSVAFIWGVLNAPDAVMVKFLLNLYRLPIEMLCAISLATAIAGLRHPKRWAIAMILAFAALSIGLSFSTPTPVVSTTIVVSATQSSTGSSNTNISFPMMAVEQELAYLATLLAISAVAVVIANRLWTVDKLMRVAVHQRTA